MESDIEFRVPRGPRVRIEDLLIDAEEAAAHFGGDDYIHGRNDGAIGAHYFKEPGTQDSIEIVFHAERERNLDTNRPEHYDYELEFKSEEALDIDHSPEGLLGYAVDLLLEHEIEVDANMTEILRVVETEFRVDSDGDFYYDNEIYYMIVGFEFVHVEGNTFAERFHPVGYPDDEETRKRRNAEIEKFKSMMGGVEKAVEKEHILAARRLLEFLVQADITKNASAKDKRKIRSS